MSGNCLSFNSIPLHEGSYSEIYSLLKTLSSRGLPRIPLLISTTVILYYSVSQ